MRVTIADVARAAGVSTATVSRVLNAKGEVDPGTADRVRGIIARLGYVPSSRAVGLARGSTRTVGMLAPSLTWPWMSEVLQGAVDAVEAAGYGLLLFTCHRGRESMVQFAEQVSARAFDGLLVVEPEDEIDAAWDTAAPHVPLLIGSTREETRLFVPRIPAIRRLAALPAGGPTLRRALVAAVTAAIYGAPARRFAARHAAAGGTAHRYVVTWAALGNPWGAAHTVDLPLLFGDEKAWASAGLLRGASWDDLQRSARRVRAVWGAFARGEDLGDRLEVPGALTVRRVGR